MLSLLDVAERVQRGPKIDEKEWDLALFKKTNEYVETYGLTYPQDGSYFNLDDAIAERAVEAAVKFLAETGIYCFSTRRIIELDEKEICSAIADAPREITVGEGKDARVIRQKKFDGGERLNHCPGHHAPFTEETAPLIVKNFAQIASVDYLEGFNFSDVDGRKIHGIATEAYAAKREASWLREGVRKAGRPGLAIAYYPINTKASTLIAPIDPDHGLRRTDGILLSVLPSLKVELDLLTAAIVYDEYGAFKINGGAEGEVGGFFGGEEGAILGSIVKTIAGWIVYRDEISVPGVWPIRYPTAKKMVKPPQLYWTWSLVLQALNTHTNFISFGTNIAGQSGPGTETHLLEIALQGIANAICGGNHYLCRQHRAKMDASQTPLEPEFMWEVGQAVQKAGITRDEGNRILQKLAAELHDRDVENGPDHISECYDLVNHKPSEAYHEIYESVKKQVREAGVPI